VGYGKNPAGITDGWIATIPEPSTLTLAATGSLALLFAVARRVRVACARRRVRL
jgi:hypothetical protein